jgi:hypothetical protein
MNIFKATIATAAVITCCLGNEYPAKATPFWMDVITTTHCEYMQMGFGYDKSLKMAISDNMIWREEIRASQRVAGNDLNQVYRYAVVKQCMDVIKDVLGKDKTKGPTPAQKQAQREFKQFYRSTSTLGYQ